ncbi:MAG: enoyl-CoA hydratase [Acidimicrobiales bacterium]
MPAAETACKVALVTLNEPARRNVMSAGLVSELMEVMDEVEADESVGALVVTGSPPAFCAGADLGNLANEGAKAGAGGGQGGPEAGLRGIYEGFLRLAKSPLPTVAAVNGAAVGAGMNLALACDVRVCGVSARFDTRFLQLGLHPGGGHTWMLQRAVGPEVAAAMVLFGEAMDGRTAAARGLVYRCVEDQDLLDTSLALANRAAVAPRELAVRVKQTLRVAGTLSSHEKAVDAEIEAQIWSLGQPVFAERLAGLRARVSGRAQR